MKKDIRNLSFEELQTQLTTAGFPKFRTKQVCDFIYKKNCASFSEIKNIKYDLKKHLENTYTLDKLKLVSSKVSSDKTVKFAFELSDGNLIESVLIVGSTRATACVSSQVGCTVNCSFCATGTMSYKRNLNAGEIFEQVFLLKKYAEENNLKFTNIVYMGMGEPFLNYKSVALSLQHISNEQYSIGFSARRITVSTSGIVTSIDKFAEEPTSANLAISLHTAIEEKRTNLMPINKKFSLEKLSDSLHNFHQKTKKRITIEYLLLKGQNDGKEDIKALLAFCKRFPVKINLIEYNPVEGIDYTASSDDTIEYFANELLKRNLVVNVRRSRGKDIDAACGQLANKLLKAQTN